jgi:sialidase-1
MKYAAAMAVALAFGAALADHSLSNPNAAKLNGGLANSRAVFETTGKGTVAFLGGSITQRSEDWYWRPIIQRSLTDRFPHTTFKFTGAGI